MLHAISGKIVERTPGQLIVEAGGIEYEIHVSLLTYEATAREAQARLLVREVITETSHQLYGFRSRDERAVFDHLMQVTGIGAKLALKILSTYPPDQTAAAISAGDVASIKRVKGVGQKKAELIIATLRKSLTSLAGSSARGASAPMNTPHADAIIALTRLGYTRAQAESALAKVAPALGPDATLEALILESLKNL